MKVQFKKLHKDATIPKSANPGDAGYDLTAVSVKKIYRESVHEIAHPEFEDLFSYDTGLAIKIPEGYVGLLFPRSSIYKKELILSNSVGVLDSGYVGPIKFNFVPIGDIKYEVGDRIGQLVIVPYLQVEFEEVEELPKTERGEQGFGSSGS